MLEIKNWKKRLAVLKIALIDTGLKTKESRKHHSFIIVSHIPTNDFNRPISERVQKHEWITAQRERDSIFNDHWNCLLLVVEES